jgi:hypothetical protein
MNAAHRREFREHACRLGIASFYVDKLTRLAATHDRLSEAACNGDWPCDNGERKVVTCSRCEGGMVRSAMYRGRATATGYLICKICRTEDLIADASKEAGIVADTQGDPRGWTVKLSRKESAIA